MTIDDKFNDISKSWAAFIDSYFEQSKPKFKSIGQNCQISPFARFYNAENIEIGNNVRIDDFCILSAGTGGIKIGDFIHIACHTTLIGQGRITLEDFSQVSSKCAIYSSNDDYTGAHLVGPTIPKQYLGVVSGSVTLKKHALLGFGTVVLPNVTIKEGAATGCYTVVRKDLDPWQIYIGNPAKPIKERSKQMLQAEFDMMQDFYLEPYIPHN
jgi:acetyltransferase-like isoleucine patch superfamily enzyme